MCGITGFLNIPCQRKANELEHMVTVMANRLAHRGPDDSGAWVDEEKGIAFGHRRLAVIDLSPEGHQPMPSASGRYIIVFNGEIYNFFLLRKELEQLGHKFRGHSDTEVMLASIEQWGLEQALQHFIGMFAFALWDRKEHILYLVRDRLGIKPLYYGWQNNTFLFGSELKALKAYPEFKAVINRDAIALLLRYNCIPVPHSIYKGIYKLPPGTVLTINAHDLNAETKPVSYWSAKEIAEAGAVDPFTGSEGEAIEQLEALLREAVKLRMIADVPLGMFLSGGVDSSTVAALMQDQSERPVKTFTIGFVESEYDEAEDARAVARHLGTEHTELYVKPKEAMAVIQRLPELYDEPFSDSSEIPTFLLSQLAREYVTVSLSGDGGDELFGGYNRHLWGQSIWDMMGRFPRGSRSIAAAALSSISPQAWDVIFKKLGAFLPRKFEQRIPGYKLHRLAEVLSVESPEEMYQGIVSHWKKPESVALGSSEPLTIIMNRSCWANLPDFAQRMMYLDAVTYLPDDILTKVDRASMGVSLEARVPLLDHRVFEFAWRIPLSMKIRNGQGKWLLRQLLYKYVPKKLIDRPKAGFGIPLGSWLRGPLREQMEDMLDERRLKEEAFLNPVPIRKKWKEHLSGKRDWQYHLWDVLVFEMWLEANAKN